MLRIEVPASTANLGPGFDSLGMALDITNTFIVEKSDTFSFVSNGEEREEELPPLEENLFFKAYWHICSLYKHEAPPLKVTVRSKIPLSRGLGSSAVIIIAGLLTANSLLTNPLSKEELILEGVKLEGHPDNILPSLLGGLMLNYKDREERLMYCSLPLPELSVIIAVPAYNLPTREAREVLPQMASREDALFNMQHIGLFIHALYQKDYSTLIEAMQDRIHQPYRQGLVPGFKRVLQAALEAGALGIALSGAGPSILAFAHKREREIGEAMVQAFWESGLKANCLLTSPRREGAVLLE